MKRMIGMVAAMALATSTAAYAQNTLPEIHQFFAVATAANLGGDNNVPISSANFSTNPNIQVPTSGGTVYLAVMLRVLQGNSPSQLGVAQYAYEIAGQSSSPANFVAGGARQRTPQGYVDIPGTPAPGVPGVLYNDGGGSPLSPSVYQMFGLSGASSGAGASASLNSNAAGDALGSTLLQIIQINVLPGTAGTTLNLYFTTPKTGASIYQTANSTTSGVGSLTTVAFGATSGGAMDQKRYSNNTADIVGSLNDRVSTTPDAVITLVPEPGTMGLVALGLLALRRRRA